MKTFNTKNKVIFLSGIKPLLTILLMVFAFTFISGCESNGQGGYTLNMPEILNPIPRTTSANTPSKPVVPAATAQIPNNVAQKPAQEPSQAKVRVALLLPLSGQHQQLGQSMLNGAQLALFNTAKSNFELVPQDTKGTPDGARMATQNALKQDVNLILGPVFSSSVRAVKPLAANANVNVIAFSTDWSLAGDNTFLMGFMPFDQINRVVSYAKSQGLDSIGLINTSNDYGQIVASEYRKNASQYGVSVPHSLILNSSNTPTQSQIQDFVSNAGGMQAVFMSLGGRSALDTSIALSQNGAPPQNIRRLGTGLLDDDGLYNSRSMVGTWFAAPPPALRASFERNFSEIYGYKPPRLTTLAYDATALAAVLSQRGASNFSREAILNKNGFAGIDGIFRFQPTGLSERGLAVLEITGNGVRTVSPAPKSFR